MSVSHPVSTVSGISWNQIVVFPSFSVSCFTVQQYHCVAIGLHITSPYQCSPKDLQLENIMRGLQTTLMSVLPFSPCTVKSPLTPHVCVETCESLNTSLASLAPSDHSDSPQFEAQSLDQLSAVTGVRHQSNTQTHAAVSLSVRLCRLTSSRSAKL